MKIAVLGAGAVGGAIGGYLTQAGRDVTLIDMWPANIDRIKTNGLTVTPQEKEFTVQAKALHIGEVSAIGETFDIVFLSVKSYDTGWASKFILPHLSSSGYIVSAQNGINDSIIAETVGWTRTVGCVVILGAGMYEPAHVLRTSNADSLSFKVGELTGLASQRVEELRLILNDVGPTKLTTNLWGERWAKLATNSMANALAGITGLKSADIRHERRTRELAIRVAAELVDVAESMGVIVEPIGGMDSSIYKKALSSASTMKKLSEHMIAASKALNEGRPSLAQDVLKGRKTEVEFLNGLVVHHGLEQGIPTPINKAVLDLTKRVESGELQPSLSNLDEIGH